MKMIKMIVITPMIFLGCSFQLLADLQQEVSLVVRKSEIAVSENRPPQNFNLQDGRKTKEEVFAMIVKARLNASQGRVECQFFERL